MKEIDPDVTIGDLLESSEEREAKLRLRVKRLEDAIRHYFNSREDRCPYCDDNDEEEPCTCTDAELMMLAALRLSRADATK